MTVQEAILAQVNGKLGRAALYRALLDHNDWRVAKPVDSDVPTIMFGDAARTPAIWTFSTEEAYQGACSRCAQGVIGAVSVVGSMVDVIVELDPQVACWYIDPLSTIALRILVDELPVVRMVARGMRLEAALSERRYELAREFGAYVVPYFGVLGQGHQVITLPSAKGNMVVAFSGPDAVDAFLATGSDEDRRNVNLIEVDGATLFGEVAAMASGVLLNAAGPRTFGFELPVCRSIATAG